MPPRHILSPQSRAALFDPPTEPTAIVRYYTFSPEDLALIRQRRRTANRLGFAVNLAYLRFPGRVLGANEVPPADTLAFIASQIRCDPADFASYAQRSETRWEHLGELQIYLGVRPFRREDARAVTHVAIEQAIGSDRGDAIVSAMIAHLRERRILLPAADALEKIALAARALARKRAYKAIIEGLTPEIIANLEALITVSDNQSQTPFAWIREWPQAPRQKNLAGLIERLHAVRRLAVKPDRERRIHQARYTAIARETAVLSAQHLSRFDTQRRLATLVVFAREMEVILTDAALVMFDKMLGSIFRRAERAYKENVVDRAKTLDVSTRALLGMAKAMLAAKEHGEDQIAAVERALGWERLNALVTETDKVIATARDDNLDEIVDGYPTVRRIAPLLLETFTFLTWKPGDPLLAALDALRDVYASGKKNLPEQASTAFLKPAWRKLMGTGNNINHRAYHVAVIMALRDGLRSGDVWVEGSRSFRAFDDFLLPREIFAARRQAGELGLAVPTQFTEWRDERVALLNKRLQEINKLAAEGKLVDAAITAEGLAISPIRKEENHESESLTLRLYSMLPRLSITDLLVEVQSWTGFADRFGHLRTGAPAENRAALMTVLLADATNLGLARMARSSKLFSHSQLLWIAEWHIRDETYQSSLACLIDTIHAHPFTKVWGPGDTSSSDGQFFRAGGHAEGGADYNAKYGSEPGVKFYTHISDRYGPYNTNVIAANASEAPYVLDGLMHHESSLEIREHYTDTAGAVDHVFGLCHFLGFRFAPRIRDLADRRIYVPDRRTVYSALSPMIGGTIDFRLAGENWDEALRFGASIKAGTAAPSAMMRRLAAYPKQNALAKTFREIGRLDRTLFTLDWISDPALRRRSNAGTNKSEAHNSLKRAVFFHRLGEIRDRTFENQRYRASGLNLVVAAITLWNTVYLARAVDQLRAQGEIIGDALLSHIAPLGWGHITFNGDYVWPVEPLGNAFRPLRNPRTEFLEAA